MTKEELAKLLGIDTKHIHWNENNPQLFKIFDTTIKKIASSIWEKDLSLEFWRCNFETNVVFPSKTNDKKIYAQINFQDCVFYSFVNARNSIFEKEFKSDFCILKDKVDFSGAEFKQKASFKASRFENEARFIQTKFQARTTESKSIENNFREAQFEGKTIFSSSVFEGRVDFSLSRFKNEARFTKTHFKAQAMDNKIIENNFREATFENKASFKKAILNGRACFNFSIFGEYTDFSSIIFKQILDFENVFFHGICKWIEATILKKANFTSSVFEQKLYFSQSRFYDEAIFDNCIFSEIDFKKAKFRKTVSFQRCTFHKITVFNQTCFLNESNFKETIFNGITSLWNVGFRKKPSLINATFGNQFNIKHHLLQYTYDEIKNEIGKQNHKDDNPSILRDLFRRLKSNRLAHHNIIDALELHTQELYAREIELGEKEKKSKIAFKEKIEKWQLWFYRLTSDHHTDLARIFNNVVLLIALFGIFACATMSFTQMVELVKPKIDNIPIYTQLQTISYIFYKMPRSIPIELGFISLTIVIFCGIYSYIKLREKIDSKIYKFKTLDMLLVFCFVCCFYYELYEAFFVLFLCFAFIVAYISCLQIDRFFITIFSYCICVCILVFKPTLLIPFIGTLFSEGFKTNIPAMQSLSVVYCILMFLMIFSLQKTARKNSIVPS